jgi:hypothetical protein
LQINHPELTIVVHPTKQEHTMQLEYTQDWQTQTRGTNDQEYQIYLYCANDGKGGDITNNGKPLKTYNEWIAS